jgi:hypothetical protein
VLAACMHLHAAAAWAPVPSLHCLQVREKKGLIVSKKRKSLSDQHRTADDAHHRGPPMFRKQQSKYTPPPQRDDEQLDSLCILGDVFSLGTYAVISAAADGFFDWGLQAAQKLNSPMIAMFNPLTEADLSISAVNGPLLTGALLTTAWLAAGSSINAFHPSKTRDAVFAALITTGKVRLCANASYSSRYCVAYYTISIVCVSSGVHHVLYEQLLVLFSVLCF